uniref:DDE Tnp4 domain-containing protein n=1 Tax=Cajanus cajan TaxID=3821 RepID=A0A151R116_CAJCA|nr:hypothetical protein KK1_042699 [Cajanus cajan]
MFSIKNLKCCLEQFLACVGLHNFLRKECHYDEFSIEIMDEPSSSTLLVNENHNFESIIKTQEQERKDTNVWRIIIVIDIWMNSI